MATKPSVALAAIGQKISATLWNNGVYRVWNFLDVTKPVCLAYQTATQSLTTSTFTAITMDSEVIDTDGQHSTSTNTSRIVIGNTLGWYRVSGAVAYAGSGAGNGRRVRLLANGGASGVIGGHGSIAPGGTGFTMCYLAPVLVQATLSTDYIELQGWQDSGGALLTLNNSQMESFLFAEYVGTLQ